jgi:N utilization substance protein B
MKTASDPRHQRRRDAVKELFAESFAEQPLSSELAKKVWSARQKLDEEIEKAATAWPIDKLNRIDLAVLRLAVYEMRNEDTPPKVIIDEAVELAKEFGSENSSSFINGVLGTIYKGDGTEQ